MSYVKDYYSGDQKVDDFFCDGATNFDTEIADLNKKIAKTKASLEDTINERNNLYTKMYKGKYIAPKKKTYLCFNGRNNTFFFSIPDGQSVNPDQFGEEYETRDVDYKSGQFSVIVGYCFEKAAAIIRNYEYKINAQNTMCKFTVTSEYIENVITGNREYNPHFGKSYLNDWTSGLDKVSADEFINTFYDINIKTDLKYSNLPQRYKGNKSLEIILRTSPTNTVRDALIGKNFTESLPVYQLMNMSKEGYALAVKEGVINDMLVVTKFKDDSKFNYTEEQWVKFIKELHKTQDDLGFYGVSYETWGRGEYVPRETTLIHTLMTYYAGSIYLHKYYSFGKFAHYVCNEVINQGYTDVKKYMKDLEDYIRMCENYHTNPSLYTSYLTLTHDIMMRNQRVAITPDVENKFQNAYGTWNKDLTGEGYKIIKPKTAKDVINEGNALNHCVASYIKRVCDGECLIYFFRKKDDESLITLEIEGNEIVQARGEHNRQPNDEESAALHKLADKLSLVCNW